MDEASHPTEYGLTELAELTGVPRRTIRYYQSEGVLPKPERRGRDAVYHAEHRDRLRLVAELQDRGLTLSTIRDLLGRKASPEFSVGDWLGLDETLRSSWSEDRPRVLDDRELGELLGDRPPGFLSRLEHASYLERQADGVTWGVPSPRLLQLALELQDAGVDLEVTGEARDLLRRRVARAVDDLIKLFVERAGAGFAGQASADELATALDALRPVARETAGIILAQEIERGLRILLEGGPGELRGRRSSRAPRDRASRSS